MKYSKIKFYEFISNKFKLMQDFIFKKIYRAIKMTKILIYFVGKNIEHIS